MPQMFNCNTFNTTYNTDYVKKYPVPNIKPIYRKKCEKPRPPVPPTRDLETLCEFRWKVPFEFGFQKKGIVDTDPRAVQNIYTKPIDKGKVLARMTRPRVIQSPAISLDGIKDENIRAIVIEDMYTSNMMKTNRDMNIYLLNNPKIRGPEPESYAASNIIKLPSAEKYVSKEWRKETLMWDRQQPRFSIDWDKLFWQN